MVNLTAQQKFNLLYVKIESKNDRRNAKKIERIKYIRKLIKHLNLDDNSVNYSAKKLISKFRANDILTDSEVRRLKVELINSDVYDFKDLGTWIYDEEFILYHFSFFKIIREKLDDEDLETYKQIIRSYYRLRKSSNANLFIIRKINNRYFHEV